MTRGTTALPVLATDRGPVLKESLVIMQYLEDLYPEPTVAQRDPYRRAVEGMLTRLEADFGSQGYAFVMNQDAARRGTLREGMLRQFARIDEFLVEHSPDRTFLWEDFGWAEAVLGRQRTNMARVPRMSSWGSRDANGTETSANFGPTNLD